MKYVGIDLHKKTIVLCVMNKERQVVQWAGWHCIANSLTPPEARVP